jgi:hypothetical protein
MKRKTVNIGIRGWAPTVDAFSGAKAVRATHRWRDMDSKFQFRAEMASFLDSLRVTDVPARRRRRVTVIEFV